MPSKWSGANPGKSVVERFQLVWPSFALHMLVHSLVWSDVVKWETRHGRLDHIVKMRADAGWLGDAPVVGVDVDDSVALVKACASWGGLNDKMVLLHDGGSAEMDGPVDGLLRRPDVAIA